jgi:hypothetical protein
MNRPIGVPITAAIKNPMTILHREDPMSFQISNLMSSPNNSVITIWGIGKKSGLMILIQHKTYQNRNIATGPNNNSFLIASPL